MQKQIFRFLLFCLVAQATSSSKTADQKHASHRGRLRYSIVNCIDGCIPSSQTVWATIGCVVAQSQATTATSGRNVEGEKSPSGCRQVFGEIIQASNRPNQGCEVPKVCSSSANVGTATSVTLAHFDEFGKGGALECAGIEAENATITKIKLGSDQPVANCAISPSAVTSSTRNTYPSKGVVFCSTSLIAVA
jgi:hypothetical protein